MKTASFLFLLLFSTCIYAQNFTSKNFTIKKLSPNVYAAIAADGGNAICNAGIVDLGKDVLVFDPFLTPAAAAELKQFIARVIKKPVKYVVNSHAHNDHTRGNQVFNGASVIGTSYIRQSIIKEEPQEVAAENQYVPGRIHYYDSIPLSTEIWQAEEDAILKGYFNALAQSHTGLKITPPDVIFKDSMSIYGSNTGVKLISYGDGHTPSDVFLYLPNEQIIFTGDLLFINFHPWILEADIDHWSAYLQKILLLNAATFIPGHGPAGNASDVNNLISYFTSLKSSALKLRGTAPTTAIIEAQIPEAYKKYHLKNFYLSDIKYLMKKL